jgi:hypothetical protein
MARVRMGGQTLGKALLSVSANEARYFLAGARGGRGRLAQVVVLEPLGAPGTTSVRVECELTADADELAAEAREALSGLFGGLPSPYRSDRIPEQREGAPMNEIITSYGQHATGG